MANSLNFDVIDKLFCPSPDMNQQFQNGADPSNIFDFSNSGTSLSSGPSLNSSNSSPPRLPTGYSPTVSIDEFGVNSNEFEPFDRSLITQSTTTLQILAQPKASYRERYCSETDPAKNRAQRFIRADDETSIYEYPTVQIPFEWCDPNRDLYIRVTLVTIFSETAPVICIHPYAIDTQESDVLKDGLTNSLYFPIMNENIFSDQKSFRISRKKMTQQDLRTYGPLRLFNSDLCDTQHSMNSYDAKQIIEYYQLWKSQLVFTIAERSDNSRLPVAINQTSVTSQTMCDVASGRRNSSVNNAFTSSSMHNNDEAICAPRHGNWLGGDCILMVIPKLDRRKAFSIYFDYGSLKVFNDIQVSFVDLKTIFFQSPACQVFMTDQNLTIPIIVTQNQSIIARVDFLYLTCESSQSVEHRRNHFDAISAMRSTTNVCSKRQLDMTCSTRMKNKRRHLILDSTETDGGESLIELMTQLTTKEKLNANGTVTFTSDLAVVDRFDPVEANSKSDKYLGQLQEAVVTFVRTGNPSSLFRRTRLLLAKCNERPPPLDDAIRHGHIEIALRLIEQVLDMSRPNDILERENKDGETPLLLAAKLNKWNLIEVMLTRRPNLSERTDKHGNTILHLLASVSDDAASQTIENVLKILPDDLRINLLVKENESKQLAMNIAQNKNNAQCIDLLKIS